MKTLIVDRVKLFRNIIVEVLRDSGVEHAFANNGEEALQMLARDSFDCICTSLVLDNMDGIELCKRIRELDRFRYTPLVLLTTETTPELTQRASASGVTDIFLKSKINELVNFIDRFSNVNKPIEGRLLYIEDQKSQRDYVSSIFRARGIAVDAFADAEQGWLAFLENHYHLVVTDIVLEGEVSGIGFINKIRRLDGLKGEVPILAVTAFDNPSRRISLFHMGITDYVTKPIIQEELLARVSNLILNQKALEREKEFRERISSEEVVRRSLKMEALGKLTGGLAHDFNNLLGVVTGYTRLLEMELADRPALLDMTQQINAAANRGVALTKKLLGFTRKQPAVQKAVDINGLLANIEDMLEKTLTASITFDRRYGEGELLAVLDPNDLQDAVLNMSINAKHAMHDQGTLTLRTERRTMPLAESEQLGLAPGDYLLLSLCDTGCGMDEETRARIFDPFFTTKGEGGTGLGLSQVYGFVKRSGGAIKVESTPGAGSCFTLYFPARKRDSVSAEAVAKVSKALPSGGGKSVLVVDDETMLCNVMKLFLEHAGYKVVVAHNTKEALELLQKNSVDLLITDIIMPGASGYVLVDQVRQLYPAMRLMISSGYDDVVDDRKAEDYQDIVRLPKPVDRDDLLSKVQELLS